MYRQGRPRFRSGRGRSPFALLGTLANKSSSSALALRSAWSCRPTSSLSHQSPRVRVLKTPAPKAAPTFLRAGFKYWLHHPEPLPATMNGPAFLIAVWMTMATRLCPTRVRILVPGPSKANLLVLISPLRRREHTVEGIVFEGSSIKVLQVTRGETQFVERARAHPPASFRSDDSSPQKSWRTPKRAPANYPRVPATNSRCKSDSSTTRAPEMEAVKLVVVS
jgi:hypothetical protein